MMLWRPWFAATLVSIGMQAGVPEDPRTNLDTARQKWESRKPSSYEFTIEVRCFCVGIAKTAPTFRVVVGKPSAVGELVEESRRFYDRYNTVDKLFAAIERSLATGRDRSSVQYDGGFGFPISANLDPRRDVFDDELYFRVTNFRAIEK